MPFWLCECTCGSGIKRSISDNALKTGDSKSCGCLRHKQSSTLVDLRMVHRK